MHPNRKPLIAGNWKMFHGGPTGCNLAAQMATLAKEAPTVDVLIAPPFTVLAACAAEAEGTPLLLGAQTMNAAKDGAHTGEISAQMLQDSGVGWVIVGHSERRQTYGDTDDVVAKKTEAALLAGIHPIVCVGETLEEREAGQTLVVVERQVRAVLTQLQRATIDVAIAYEPIWAIGTGKTAGPAEAEEVHAAIRGWLAEAGDTVRILYGGSVKASNAKDLLACANVDGALVGGASLDVASFGPIVAAAAQILAAHPGDATRA